MVAHLSPVAESFHCADVDMSGGKTKLSASWQLNAALLSRPVDLTSLVSMVRDYEHILLSV